MENLESEKELVVADPVCGMRMQLEKAVAHEEYEGWAYFFCSDVCHRRFLSAPERFPSSRPSATTTGTD